MHDQVIINYIRPGKEITRYIETRVEENLQHIKTVSHLSPEFSRKWCEETWWKNRTIPHGVLVASVVKVLFFHEWFAVMQLLDEDEQHLGYYVDIISPVQLKGDEYFVTDLFLDLWIKPGGAVIELDWDEFQDSVQKGLVTVEQHAKASETVAKLKQDISSGEFFLRLG